MRSIIFLVFFLCSIAKADDSSPSRFSVSLEPDWYHVTRENYNTAFTNNNFSTPSKNQAGLSALFFWTTDSDWQLGFGFGGFSANQDPGSYEATYSDNYFGIYGGKNLTPGKEYDFTVGALLAGSVAQLEVLSASQNGKEIESAALIEPRIGFAYRVARILKVGIAAAYIIPFGESLETKGQNLGVSKISARALTVGIQFVLGRFQ